MSRHFFTAAKQKGRDGVERDQGYL